MTDMDVPTLFLTGAETCALLVSCVLFAVILYKFLTCNIPCAVGNPFALAMSCLR